LQGVLKGHKASSDFADAIVNAAAHTAVDKAESEPEQAALLNAAAPAVLAARLARRGREDARQIEARLARKPSLKVPAGARIVRIDNSGLLADAGSRFLGVVEEAAQGPRV